MTRMRVVGAGLAGLMVLFVLVPAAASAGDKDKHSRYYRGETSQGEPVIAKTHVEDATRLGQITFSSVTINCEDGTQLQGSMGISWALPMSAGRFDFDDVFSWGARHLHGRLGVYGGSGTFSFTWPALTADEQAQLCTTGELTWQVERTAAKVAAVPSSEAQTRITVGADGTMRTVTSGTQGIRTVITSGPDGTMSTAVTSGTKTATGASHLRNYDGRTSQALGMFVDTEVGSTIKVRALGVEWSVGCEDGTQFDDQTNWVPFTVPPARLDLDYLLLYGAAHIHGRLGTHVGSGAASHAVPTLTADEQAQLCTTGDLTWRAWRVDAGARPIVP